MGGKELEMKKSTTSGGPRPGSMMGNALIKLTKYQTYNPCTMLAVMVGLIMLLSVMALAPGVGMEAMSPQTSYDFMITGSPYVERFDLLSQAEAISDKLSTAPQERSISSGFASLTMLYKEQADTNVLTPANIKAICETERLMVQHADYEKFCLLDPATNFAGCKAQTLSIPQIFYQINPSSLIGYSSSVHEAGACGAADLYHPTTAISVPSIDYECGLLPADKVNAVNACINAKVISGSDTEKMIYTFYVGSDLKAGHPYTQSARSFLQLGLPLKGFTGIPCDLCTTDEQFKPIKTFYQEVAAKFFKSFGMTKTALKTEYATQPALPGGAHVYWMNFPLLNTEIQGLLGSDMTFVLFSIVFVITYMNIHLGSWFITLVSVWQICMSLTVAIFFYYVVFGIKFYAVLQGLTIFLVLGIGADDVFVIVDAWKQSKYDFPKTKEMDDKEYIHKRLLFASGRAMEAVFNTTFTTSVAFIGTAISPIMPISTFGIYAAIAIILNYVFVLTVTPACLVINEHWGGFEAGTGPYWFRSLKKKVCCKLCAPATVMQQDEYAHVADSCCCPTASVVAAKGCKCPEVGLSLLLGNFYTLCCWNPKSEKASTGCCPVLGAAPPTMAITVAPEAGAGEQQEAPAAPVPAFYKKFYLPAMKTPGVAAFCVLFCVGLGTFGVYGALKLQLPSGSEDFLPDTHPLTKAQKVMKDDFSTAAAADYAPINFIWGLDAIDRKASKFNRYIPDKKRGVPTYDVGFDIYDQTTQQQILAACNKNTGIITTFACDLDPGCYAGKLLRVGSVICFIEEFNAWHQTEYSGALPFNSVSHTGASDRATFITRLIKFRKDTKPESQPTGSWEKIIGVVKGEVKYVVVPGRLNLQQFQEGSSTQEAVSVKCDTLIDQIHAAQPGLKHHYSAFEFTWMATGKQLLTGLYVGLGIAASFALLVLTFATQNIIVAFLAITSIGGIIVTLLGFGQQVLGWELGIVESVAAIIVVGFSVDYTIHLGHMYNHAGVDGLDDRKARFEYAIRKMGGTVMGGAITTGGSGAFMMFATMVFFSKMAFMITTTIILSLFWSLFFFMPVLYLAGPQGKTGNIKHMIGMK